MFYNFRQNNTHGRFTGPAINVTIEADSPSEANEIALEHGVYFDKGYERDCQCCGTRWYEVEEYDAKPNSQVYDKPDLGADLYEGQPWQLIIAKESK